MLYLCEYGRINTLGVGVVDYEEYFAGPYPLTVELLDWVLDVGAAGACRLVHVSTFHPHTLRDDGFRLPAWVEFVGTYTIDADRVPTEPVAADVGHQGVTNATAEVERLRVENSDHWDEIQVLRDRLRSTGQHPVTE